jgi:hypothetical protein
LEGLESRGELLQLSVSSKIRNLDFMFENSPVKVIANRSSPEIRLAGLTVGPFEEGGEYEVYYWVARELERSGIIRFRSEELLDTSKLYKIQWRERVQPAGQISELPKDFYPKLRRHLSELKEKAGKNPEKMLEYEKARQLAIDVLNMRLKKILAIASAPAQTEQFLKNFTTEERVLYEKVFKLVNAWKTLMLQYEGGGGE